MSHYKKVEYGKKPNFLASEVGLRLITGEINALSAKGVVANNKLPEVDGKVYAPAGCYVTVGDLHGFLFNDVELPSGENATVECSVIVAGHLYSDKLAEVTPWDLVPEEEVIKQGLFFETSDTITRPTE